MIQHAMGGGVLDGLKRAELEARFLPVSRADDSQFQMRVRTFIVIRDMSEFQQGLLCSILEMVPAAWFGCGQGVAALVEHCLR